MDVKPITVLVVDDHALIHEAIRSRLDDYDDIKIVAEGMACLLYTSDAADERSSVNLGGRRHIKKKKKHET